MLNITDQRKIELAPDRSIDWVCAVTYLVIACYLAAIGFATYHHGVVGFVGGILFGVGCAAIYGSVGYGRGWSAIGYLVFGVLATGVGLGCMGVGS